MKKLVKIKLINWYTFSNSTIPLHGNALISGQNGSGKSTLLDAIQYVLTAGNAKFNKAANDKSKRTLETYVRGKINTDSKDFLRPGDVTSYICLQLEDEVSQRTDLIGVVIEIPSGSKVNRTFFKMTNEEIKDSLFSNNGVIKTLNEFKKSEKVEKFEQKSEIQAMIKSVLGLSKDKYFDLLNRALAFQPITDLNEFVNTFLLQENQIDLGNLQDNINHFHELQEIIEKEENKMIELEKIEKDYENYKQFEENNKRLNWIFQSIKVKRVSEEIKKIETDKKAYERKIDEIESSITKNENKIKTLKESIKLYEKGHKSDKNFDLYIELQRKVTETKEHINSIRNKYENYIKTVKEENKNLSQFLWANIEKIINEKELNGRTYLKEYQRKLEQEKEKIRGEKEEYEKKRKEVLQRESESANKLNRLNKNQFPYEGNVTTLIDAIKNQLERKYDSKIEVRPLCEYLSIEDDKWINAIEGYLNTQRFDLIVDPKYFDDALFVYEEEKREKKIHGVGLVNTNKLQEVDKINENTLASKVKSSNPYAKMYMAQLLNDVVCCEKVEELKKYKKSITPTCMTYRNNVARQINPHVYEDKFIGERAKKEQLEKYQKAFKQSQDILKEINSVINEMDKKLNILANSKVVDLLQDIDVVRDYQENKQTLKEQEQEMEKLKEYKLLFDMISEIEKKQKEKEELEEKTRVLKDDKGSIYLIIQNLTQKIAEKQEEKANLVENLSIEKEEWVKDIPKYNEGKVEIELRENSNKQAKLESIIEIELDNFNKMFSFDEIPNIMNVEKYIEYLYKLREQEIVKYKSKSAQFKETCQKSFREDFLVNLRHSIEKAQDEIKELNNALKGNKFGKERYEFVYLKSDDPELGKYYDIIISGADYIRNSLFSDDLTEEQKDSLEVLFDKILSSNSEVNMKKIVEEYTDYRKYMSYDIKVTNEDGESYLFSKVAREKSGGEIQTPFYVIIASSFEQLLKSGRRNDSIGCIVLFDEAFNNMDGSRIDAMMKFYKKLNIQLLIAVPTEKIATIAPCVDTNLIIEMDKYKSNVISIRTAGVLDE